MEQEKMVRVSQKIGFYVDDKTEPIVVNIELDIPEGEYKYFRSIQPSCPNNEYFMALAEVQYIRDNILPRIGMIERPRKITDVSDNDWLVDDEFLEIARKNLAKENDNG